MVLTAGGESLPYDALLMATDLRERPAVPGAVTCREPENAEAELCLMEAVEGAECSCVAFVAPPGAGWTLPLYELALQTARRVRDMDAAVELSLTTPEPRPLSAFGGAPSELAAALLNEAGIRFSTGTAAPGADRVVALGVPAAPAVPGLAPGFLPVDDSFAVGGLDDVWAAGDLTGELRHGGLATQQAATAASAIAVAAGAQTSVDPYQPVLRALLVASRRVCYFRRRLDGIDPGMASRRALWWPPSRLAGARLGPFLDGIDARGRTSATPDVLIPPRLAGDYESVTDEPT